MKKLFSIILAVVILGTVFILPVSADDDTLELEVVNIEYVEGLGGGVTATVSGKYRNNTGYSVSLGDSVWYETTEGEYTETEYLGVADDGSGSFSFEIYDVKGEITKIEIPQVVIEDRGETIAREENIVIYDTEKGVTSCSVELEIDEQYEENDSDTVGVVAAVFLVPIIAWGLIVIAIIVFITLLLRFLNKKNKPGSVTFTYTDPMQNYPPQNNNNSNNPPQQ